MVTGEARFSQLEQQECYDPITDIIEQLRLESSLKMWKWQYDCRPVSHGVGHKQRVFIVFFHAVYVMFDHV